MKAQIINIEETKDKVTLQIEFEEKVEIYKFGFTFYSVVSDNVPKSSIRHIAQKCFKDFDLQQFKNTYIEIYEIRRYKRK